MDNRLTLAITKIGDLLLRQTLTECDSDAVGRVDLAIPDYQRPYKWTEKNAIQLR